MADQKINALPTKTAPVTGDKCLMSGAAEEYLIDYDKLATAILNKLTSKTFTLDQGTKTLIAALNELNSKFAVIESGEDVLEVKKSGIFYARDGVLNLPITGGGMLIVSYYASSYKQLIFLGNGNRLFTQTFISSSTGSGWDEK